MWRRVASQSPHRASGPKDPYIKAFTALGQMLRDGRSLSGHERNCCFLNTRDDRFATISSATGLDFADDGRALGLTDWDQDGDLDVWLANRTGPRLRFMRNDSRASANFVTFKLTGTTCNRDAVGARLELHLRRQSNREGKSTWQQIRSVHAGRGFMSQASKRIHFGLGHDSIEKLVVRWPDGRQETFKDLQSGCHYEITQGDRQISEWTRPASALSLKPSMLEGTTFSNQSRVVVLGRLPLPSLEFTSIRTDPEQGDENPTLINLWSTSCLPCIQELTEFSRRESDLRLAGINVLALNVDELIENPAADVSRCSQILDEMAFPFSAAAIHGDDAGMLDLFHQAFLSLRLPLPLPSSFLTTADGRLAVIYRGPIKLETLMRDLASIDDDPVALRDHAVPFAGRWYAAPITPDAKRHATAFLRGGYLDRGAKYLERYLLAHLNQKGWGPQELWPSRKRLAELCDVLANFYRLQNAPNKVVGVYQVALKFDPTFVPSFVTLGKVMIGKGEIGQGLRMLEQARRLAPSDPVVASDLAIAYAMTGRAEAAEPIFLELCQEDSDPFGARLNLGRLYFQTGRFGEAAIQFRNHLSSDPDSVEALRSLGWIFAASPNDGERDLPMAKECMKRLRNKAQRETAETHDLRAAIYAEVGDFERAVAEVRHAMRLAREQQNASLVQAIQQRLESYLRREPYRLR